MKTSSTSPVPLYLTFPVAGEAISGGHLYNARLAAGLAARGALSTLPIDSVLPELTVGTPGCFLLDSLDIARVETLPTPTPQQRLVLIAHHLPSLDCFGEEAAEARALAQARERELLKGFDLVVATGAYASKYLVELGVPESRIALIPPAPPPRSAVETRPAPPPVRALLVANVIPRKGVMDLLEALATELRDDHVFELTIAGRLDLDAAYASTCQAFVSSTPLSRVVRFTGAVPPSEMGVLYQTAHVVVSSSRMETFGMALQEARSYGLPIYAFDAGNVAEHVLGGGGCLFTSIPRLARALLDLIEAPEKVSVLLSRASTTQAKTTYDWVAVAQAFLDACDRCPPRQELTLES